MRAHAEAVGYRLKLLLLFVDAVAATPPPRLVNEWTVCGVHHADDSMIDAAWQVGGQVCGFVFLGKAWHARGRRRGVFAASEACASRAGIGNEYPYECVALFAGKAAGINAFYFQILIGRE